MASDSSNKKKPGRIARQFAVANQIRRKPGSIVGLLRGWLLGLWQARGGGFYGLGFVLTFVVLEVRMFIDDISGGDSASQIVVQQLFEFAFRFGVMSFVNGLLALLWPAFLLNWLGAWGIALLLLGFFAFERGLRPLVESWFPELQETRVLRALQKREKKEQKEKKKAARKSTGRQKK